MRKTLFLLALLIPGAVRPAAAQTLPREPGWIGVDAALIVVPGTRPVMIVRGVAVGSPAEQAGLTAGDTLVALGGMAPTFERFPALRMALRPGDPLELTVRNGQKPRTLVVRAARRPSDMDLAVTVQVNGLPDGWMTPYLVGQDRVAGA